MVNSLCDCILIAERSEANNRVLWAPQSQLAFIYIYRCLYFYKVCSHLPKARVQKWRLWQFFGCRLRSRGGHKVRGLDKFVTKFYQGRLTTAPRLVELV